MPSDASGGHKGVSVIAAIGALKGDPVMKLAVILAAAALVATAPAAAKIYTTTLSGLNENPANASTASSTGFLDLAADGNSFHVIMTWTGLTNNAGAGHIHCCVGPTGNATVAIGFAPSATKSGTFDAVYNLTSLSTYSSGFRSANGGTITSVRAAFLAGLAGGNVYLNIHDAPSFAGGEIRGQLAAVPEPAAWALMIGGFGLVGGALRQRRTVAA